MFLSPTRHSRVEEEIHIGKLIYSKLKEDGHSVAWFARRMNCDRTNVYKIFHKPYIDVAQLLQISLILNYDFFSCYSKIFFKGHKDKELPIYSAAPIQMQSF